MSSRDTESSSASTDWSELTRRILESIDLQSEAESLGVKFAASTPSAAGWLQCHAVDRDDNSPSAAICVAGKNGSLGLYKDLGGDGKAISFFELAAKLGSFADWRAARAHFADRAGVDIPRRVDAEEQLVWRDWNHNTARAWCKHYKQGVTVESLIQSGARMCVWPKSSPDPFVCIALPAYRGPGSEPETWALYRVDGQEFPAYEKRGMKARKVHNLRGGHDAWINVGGPEAWAEATRFWRCEGPTDALALQAILPAGELAISNATGCNADPVRLPMAHFAGKPVVVLGDADMPGQKSADRYGIAFAAAGASDTRVARFPYPVEEKHGRDARDWVNDGGQFEDLVALAAAGAVVDSAKARTAFDVDNYETEYSDDGKPVRRAIPLPVIAAKIQDSRGGWPKSIGGVLFVEGRPSGIVPDVAAVRSIRGPNSLFAWLRDKGDVRWVKQCSDSTPPSMEQLYEYLYANSKERFSGVFYLPHFPKIPHLYYVPTELPEATMETLMEFVGHFNPATDMDRDLLIAAMLTPGWGGPPGQRPAFIITSDHGRGAGKTKTAEAIAEIWGGAISTNLNKKNAEEFRARLLDDTGLQMRCALLDNIKGIASSAELESMITTKTIDGKRMYHGDFRRPNYLTWFVTANSPTFSKDLSDRSVLIKIGAPKIDDFSGWVSEFLDNHRLALIADLLSILESPDQCELSNENLDRWNSWQRGVLAKFKNGNEMAAHIRGARPSVDIDSEDAESIADEIRELVASVMFNGVELNPDDVVIGIPNSKVYDRLRKLWNELSLSDKAVRYRINDLMTTKPMANVTFSKCNTFGRTMIWRGMNTEPRAAPCFPWSKAWVEEHDIGMAFRVPQEQTKIYRREDGFR